MNGIIILDKPTTMFSRKAGRIIANFFDEKKFGHLGTLDPMATGVLPIFIGNATKIIPFLEQISDNKKEYLFGIKFGIQTDTLDITGKQINQSDIIPTVEEIQMACNKLKGEILQIPPQYSAIHINGQRAYDLARKGQEFDITPRKVTIYNLEYIDTTDDIYNFRVVCSTGTYVRSIVKDISNLCGAYGTTTYIRRTYTNGFDIKNAVQLDFLENLHNNNGDITKYLLSSDCALGDIPAINLCDKDAILFQNGGFITTSAQAGLNRIYSGKDFIGIGFVKDGLLKPKRII